VAAKIVHSILFLFCFVTQLMAESAIQFNRSAYYIEFSDLENEHRTIYLPDQWQYHPGDDLSMASIDIDDSDWELISTLLGPNQLPLMSWEGIGWFRLVLDVDSTLIGVPLGIDIPVQNGASEIYLNGLLVYSFGTVSADSTKEILARDRSPRSIVFTTPGRNVLAVRYSNHRANNYIEAGYNAGFRYMLVDLNYQVNSALKMTRWTSIHQFLFSGILLVFTIIHFLLFLFYPKQKQNLYFALFTCTFGIMNYLSYEVYYSTMGMDVINLAQLQFVMVLLTMLFFLLFSYSLYYAHIPRQFWLFSVSFLTLGFSFSTSQGQLLEMVILGIVALFVIEVIRILLVAAVKKRKGALVFSIGLILFMTAEIYSVGVNLDYFASMFSLSSEIAGITGIVVLLITMSVSLSRGFAETNLRLEYKLKEVKELSDKAIEQERLAKQKEIDRVLLEADNNRKTYELEEARKLQLSMLPVGVPGILNVEFSARIRTATEVGGDYYDFCVGDQQNKELTVVIGDATGHGVKAGIIVASVKSYFKTFAVGTGLVELLRLMSKGLKNMQLRMMYMTLTLVRYNGRHLEIVGAGMPPALFYEASTGSVSIITTKGMPLGSKPEYPYEVLTKRVVSGDVLVLMSDGIMEAFNTQRKQLGLSPIVYELSQKGSGSPDEILDAIENLTTDWIQKGELEDDYTLIAMKFH
jgi:serine phosphatase RsbU (regulator of sigma subunit)